MNRNNLFFEHIQKIFQFCQSLWVTADEITQSRLSCRSYVFCFRDITTFNCLVSLGSSLGLPFVFHSDVFGRHFIDLDYDFILKHIYKYYKNYDISYVPF